LNFENLKAQWAELPDWQKILFVSVVTFAIAYMIYFLFIGDQILRKNNLEREVNGLQREVERLKMASKPEIKKRLTKKLKELEREIEQLNKKLSELKNIIPEKENPQYLLTFISSEVESNGLILDSFEISKPEDVVLSLKNKNKEIRVVKKTRRTSKREIKLKRITLTVKLFGDLRSLYSFIEDLGKSERYIRVDKVSINKDKSSLLSIELQISTFYLPERS